MLPDELAPPPPRPRSTIIDAGLPGYWRLLIAELASIGKSLDNLRALVLTHGDTDHIGFAVQLYRETRIAADVHTADADVGS